MTSPTCCLGNPHVQLEKTAWLLCGVNTIKEPGVEQRSLLLATRYYARWQIGLDEQSMLAFRIADCMVPYQCYESPRVMENCCMHALNNALVMC